jgi:cell division transport system permease protein
MSTTDPIETMAQTMREPWDELDAAPSLDRAPWIATSIVPKSSIAGRSLAAVVAIMTFLAALTTGAAMLVVSMANDWQSDVGREVTIQVRPAAGRDIETDVRKAIEIARAAPGIADVRAYSKEESEQLVEPWLGAGLHLDELPIPRLIVIKLLSGVMPDFAALRKTLADQVATASLDDHRGWIERMRTMAGTAVACGLAVLGLVLAVTMLSVTFATRGAMATNRPIVEVLHYVGATDRFVARQFQRHFLLLGFKGGAIGGGAAIVLFGCVEAARAWFAGTPGGDEAAALFGSFSIGVEGYLASARSS